MNGMSTTRTTTTTTRSASDAHNKGGQQQQQQQHGVDDTSLTYIYILEETLFEDTSFNHENEPVPPSFKPLSSMYSRPPHKDRLNNILAYPFPLPNDINTDLSTNKEIFEYIKFFDVKDEFIFHHNTRIKRYSRYHLNLTLKFMCCKSVHARQITSVVFDQMEKCRKLAYSSGWEFRRKKTTTTNNNSSEEDITNGPIFCVSLLRSTFYHIVRHVISTYQYSKPHHISDFPVACEVQEKKHSFTILLGGTSGCGKSTLTALLASRIGFAAVISTDNIRQILRKFISRAESPILWASTYHAGEIISDPSLSHKEKILQGYEAQNEMIFNKLDVLIEHYEKRNESLIVEGVHLDTRIILRLVKKHPSCIPFLMYISNEAKHKERFAIRSKYMTLDPHQNKYTKYFKNIRIINDYLCQGADSALIPQIDNTSIDRSLATIHSTIFACLKRKVYYDESYYNPETNQLDILHQQYEQIQHQFWSSKGMLRLIQKKKVGVQSVAEEETFNSDDEEEEEQKRKAEKLLNREKSVSAADPNLSDSETESDSESHEDGVGYFDMGSLGS
ncbi:hypothetical protein SAMD00019534_070200 [Acytostelium subglobosum LB1]|uniref:hypothetical protein n=1 Tax=Acytostelium subglobosum LB1 TaxID=1410327 RepID=UPI000644B0FF|nr:hypothetical protein SAMD00019534_070200 [Acytostelium subglobosum LB1]GAM23845.1 hypothetical protein SAMD00019534_070200 [Acytostelium subglobosum LB1]|eukprot:XP_012752881.1 hypothetical protein SAMD00019534_070200 [Acytostelium subglobosum LB1]